MSILCCGFPSWGLLFLLLLLLFHFYVVSLTSLCEFQASYPQSLISEMFGGFLRSSVHQAGLKDSANVEPFFELQLDVQVCNLRLMSEGLNGVLDLTAHGSNFDHSTANG